MKFSIVALAALATIVVASPIAAPEAYPDILAGGELFDREADLAKRDTQFRLPPYMILWAMVNNTIIGNIQMDGNFTRVRNDPIFWAMYTSGNNGNDGTIYSPSYGVNCTDGPGPLDGAKFQCATGNQAYAGQWWDRDGYVSVDGPTGTWFSISSWPAANDPVGVPVTVGGSGGYLQFQIYAHNAQG